MSELYDKLLEEKRAEQGRRAARAAKPEPAHVPHFDDQTPLYVIADAIGQDPAYEPARWCAEPYRYALAHMIAITDNYGADDGPTIAVYLLANLQHYRGPRARAVKAELRKRLRAI